MNVTFLVVSSNFSTCSKCDVTMMYKFVPLCIGLENVTDKHIS